METNKSYIMHTYNQLPNVFTHGEGLYLVDEQENRYLDFVAGIAVNALGYSHQGLRQALHKQVDEFLHCSNLYFNDEQLKAAKKITQATQMDRVFFCNSGTEAVEASLKLARKYAKFKGNPERYEIITMKNSFHGRTLGAISATGQTKYQEGLNPLLPGIKHVEYNNIKALEEAISDKTCGIMMEVIQGEGGIIAAQREYIEAARKLCDKNGCVLIFDEVQTGIGRTGEVCAYMHYDIKPDIIALAKGLGAGVAVGAMLASEEVAKGFKPGDHAATFGGNPLAMSAVNVVLDNVMSPDFLNHVQAMGAYLSQQLNRLKEEFDSVKEVRGMGLMQGIVIDEQPSAIVKKAYEKKLLIVGAGSNVIRFVPPLVVHKEHIDICMQTLREVLL
ncbi:aspartate aminotransferase family protein [Vallitaleaceae bacterium 9-2]